jgi:hypothetical protein
MRPDRGSCCLDTGVYVINFKECAECGKRDFPVPIDKERVEPLDSDEENQEEEVTFKHKCKHCDHIIAEHYYSFNIEENRENFIM